MRLSSCYTYAFNGAQSACLNDGYISNACMTSNAAIERASTRIAKRMHTHRTRACAWATPWLGTLYLGRGRAREGKAVHMRAAPDREREGDTERVRVTGTLAQKGACVAGTSIRVDECCSGSKQLRQRELYRSRRRDGSARKLEARLPLYCTHCTLPMPFHAERVTCNHPHRAALVRARPGEEGWAAVRVSDCQQQRHAGTPAHGLTHPLLHFRTCGNSSWTTPKT